MSIIMLIALGAASLPDNALTLPPRQIRALTAEYADCVVKHEQRSAAEAILMDVSDRDLHDRYPQLLQDSCVPMKMGEYIRVDFTPGQIRDAIAEALFRREFASRPPPVLDDIPGLSHRAASVPSTTAASADDPAYQKLQLSAYLSRFGECVVRVDPTAAKALLLSDPETNAEATAFNTMGTVLGTCVAEGKSLNFGKAALRGSIAVNYYRLAVAARNAPAAGAPK